MPVLMYKGINLSGSSKALAGSLDDKSEDLVATAKMTNELQTKKAPLESPVFTGAPEAPTADKGTSSTQIATTAYVQTEVTELKKSVSDGKTLVANAITEKGIETATDASFATIAENISNISTGAKLNIFTQLTEPDIKDGIWVKTGSQYQRVVNDNRVLGDDGVWDDTMIYPFWCAGASGCLFNGEIHVFGGFNQSTYVKSHYKLNDDNTWTLIGETPTEIYASSCVLYNGAVHILGGKNKNMHYKFDGDTWTALSELPITHYFDPCAVFNNEIHIFGDDSSNLVHYKFDGNTWVSVSTLPYNAHGGLGVVFNGELHLLGGYANKKMHYKFNSSTWTSVSTLPLDLWYTPAIVYNGCIHIFRATSHYKFDSNTWTSVSTLNFYAAEATCVVNDDYFILINANNWSKFTTPENIFDANTIILQRGDHDGVYLTNFVDVSNIPGDHNRFVTGFDDVWYFDQTAFDHDSEMYYGDGTQWIKFKN